CALLASFCLYYYPSYEKDKDNFGIHIFEKFELLPKNSPLKSSPMVAASFLYAVVAVLALMWYFVRRSQHGFWVSYFCCYYEAMGAVALIPQLWMFHQDKRVSPLLSYFVVLTALNRFFTLCFWICYPRVFLWRYPDNRGVQMVSETLNLLILSDFLFYWARSKIRGDAEVIIGDSSQMV
ncbi:kdelr, partial [Symbiodinium necroappetens]